MKTYGGLARFLEDTGDDGVTGIRNLESRVPTLTLFNLRSLEQLMTPSSRHEVLLAMRENDINLHSLEKCIDKAVHAMWCHFYWTRADYIHPDKGIFISFSNHRFPSLQYCPSSLLLFSSHSG